MGMKTLKTTSIEMDKLTLGSYGGREATLTEKVKEAVT